MLPLILFIVLAIVIVVLFEIRERRRARTQQSPDKHKSDFAPSSDNTRPEGCCGEHLVCERETLLQTNAQIEYYDDEELDTLSGMKAEEYTPEQHEMVRAVFTTLQESDVPGWCRSMQLRNIALPEDIREEALLIVRERRNIR